MLLEALDKDKIEIPYRWRSAFEASLESDYQWLESGGLNAAIVLPVRRKSLSEEVGEVLLLKRKLTIPLVKNSSGPGGGYRVPVAVLDKENCYIISNELKSQIVITSLESKAGAKLWETTLPLVYSLEDIQAPVLSMVFRMYNSSTVKVREFFAYGVTSRASLCLLNSIVKTAR